MVARDNGQPAAVAFLRELGMRDPVAATYRGTGAATAERGAGRLPAPRSWPLT